jgi:hypothetical protein
MTDICSYQFLRRIRAACLLGSVLVLCAAKQGAAQITAQARSGPGPAWTKGILPISPETYYNAIECGKQDGQDPPCVFWDTGLCKNDDFALAMYTPYKAVAYEVWRVVSQKQPAPTPNYREAQQTRITVGITPMKGSRNTFTDLVLKRGGQAVAPVARSTTRGGGRFTFDFPAFAPTADVTLELTGREGTLSCLIPRSVLAQFR